MDHDVKNINWIAVFFIAILSFIVIIHYLLYYDLLALQRSITTEMIYNFYYKVSQGYGLLIIRGGIILSFIALLLYKQYSPKTKYSTAALIISPFLIILFVLGYENSPILYGKYIFPFIFLSSFIIIPISITHFTRNLKKQNLSINRKKTENSIPIVTVDGTGYILNPFAGIWSEAGPGSGKTVSNIIPALNEFIKKGFCGIVYDYECDLSEGVSQDGQEPGLISKHCFHFLSKYNTGVKFALFNLVDLTRTVKVNPISPQYIKGFDDALEISITMMLNLNREWAVRRDFWADNAIYAFAGTIWHFVHSKPEFATIPHCVEFLLRNFSMAMHILILDEEVRPYIQPVIAPFQKSGSGGQAAGVESSTQFSVAKLRSRESYYCLSPKPEEELNLDITNLDNPILFCVGNAPVKTSVYAPVLSSVIQCCKKNMNRLGKHKSVFCIDELPSIYIHELEKIPAEARKKKVVTFLAIQTYAQLEDKYGDKKAKIIFDTCGNYFIGRTTYESAEKLSKMLGDFKKEDLSRSYSDSGSSHSVREQYERLVRVEDITSQAPGHFVGLITGGEPAFFSVQLKHLKFDKEAIPSFNPELMNKSPKEIEEIIETNFQNIIKDIDNYVLEYSGKININQTQDD